MDSCTSTSGQLYFYQQTAVLLLVDLQLYVSQEGGLEGASDSKDRHEVLHAMRVGEARVLLQVEQKVLLTNITGDAEGPSPR